VTFYFWAILAGAVTPLGAYLANYILPWTSQTAAQVVQGAFAAAGGAIAALLDAGSIDFDKRTFSYIATAMLASLAAHFGYSRGEGADSINVRLGGGRNLQDKTER
jgi:hypothetical protein